MLSFETSTWMPPMGDKKKRKDTDLNFVPFQMTKYSMIQCQREHLTVNIYTQNLSTRIYEKRGLSNRWTDEEQACGLLCHILEVINQRMHTTCSLQKRITSHTHCVDPRETCECSHKSNVMPCNIVATNVPKSHCGELNIQCTWVQHIIYLLKVYIHLLNTCMRLLPPIWARSNIFP